MAYELVETIELTSDAAYIEFANIPQDAKDLVLRISVRTSGSQATYDIIEVDKNGTTGWQTNGPSMYGDPTFGIGSANGSYVYVNREGGDVYAWSNNEIYISNYATTKVQHVGGYGSANNYYTDGFVCFMTTHYASGSAITSLRVKDVGTISIVSGSVVSLYKIY